MSLLGDDLKRGASKPAKTEPAPAATDSTAADQKPTFVSSATTTQSPPATSMSGAPLHSFLVNACLFTIEQRYQPIKNIGRGSSGIVVSGVPLCSLSRCLCCVCFARSFLWRFGLSRVHVVLVLFTFSLPSYIFACFFPLISCVCLCSARFCVWHKSGDKKNHRHFQGHSEGRPLSARSQIIAPVVRLPLCRRFG